MMANESEILRFSAKAKAGPPNYRWQYLRVVIAIYWAGMFAGTHVPHEPHLFTLHLWDKVMHFSAFLGLAVLLSIAWVQRHRVMRSMVLKIVLLLAAYGCFDEVTQPLVGRDCEMLDWIADVSGAIVGSCIVLGLTILWHESSRKPADDAN